LLRIVGGLLGGETRALGAKKIAAILIEVGGRFHGLDWLGQDGREVRVIRDRDGTDGG
jgi:hypothetical protein